MTAHERKAKIAMSLIKDVHGALDPNWFKEIVDVLGLKAFVETGTYLGQSLENIASLFETAVSIELSDELYAAACARFASRGNVKLLHGDSARRIEDAADLCAGGPVLYWLDA